MSVLVGGYWDAQFMAETTVFSLILDALRERETEQTDGDS